MNEQTVSVDLYTADDLDKKSFLEQLKWAGQADQTFIICERTDQVQFFTLDQPFTLDDSERGRLFNEKLEVRWEKSGTGYRAVLTIAAADLAPEAGWNALPRQAWITDERTVYLWGADDVRIGHRFDYSTVGITQGRVQAVVQTYLDPDTYKMRHYRYVRIQAEPEEAKP